MSSFQQHVDSLESQLDDLEQYSGRNCVEITGIVKKNENTDEVALNFINKLNLGPERVLFSVDKIERTHRVGKPCDNRSSDIAVKLVSYRDRALVDAKKKNLKTYN